MINFKYPNALNAQARKLFWTYTNLLILAFGLLLSIVGWAVFNTKIFVLAELIFGIGTFQYEANSETVFEMLRNMLNFLFKPQIGEYGYVVANKKTTVKQKKRTSKKQPKSNNLEIRDPSKSNLAKLMVFGVFVVVVLGFVVIQQFSNVKKTDDDTLQKIDAEVLLTIDTDKASAIEYGSEINLNDLIVDTSGTVTVAPETIDTKVLGETEVIYTVTNEDGLSKEFTETLTVVDTVAPEIKLKSESITVPLNSEFDPNNNIESVTDTGYGALSVLDSLDYDSYTIRSTVNTSTAGSYTVTVTALDGTGNRNEKVYTVIVE